MNKAHSDHPVTDDEQTLTLPRSAEGLALFLDVDGTLLEIAGTPEEVRVEARLHDVLDRLRRRLLGAVALVSGRPISDLDRLFELSGLPAAGLHGLERRRADGTVIRAAGDRLPDDMRRRLDAFAGAHPGVLIEDKGAALALHYRGAPSAEAAGGGAGGGGGGGGAGGRGGGGGGSGGCWPNDAGAGLVVVRGGGGGPPRPPPRLVAALLAGTEDRLALLDGKMVLEIRHRGSHKGDAVAAFMAEPPFAGRRAVFIGDDVTDEDGFDMANRMGGWSIRVGDGRETRARLRLPDVSSVIAWLDRLATTREDAS